MNIEQWAEDLQKKAQEEGIDSSAIAAPHTKEKLDLFSRLLAEHIAGKKQLRELYRRAEAVGYAIQSKPPVPYRTTILHELEERIQKAEREQKEAQELVARAHKVGLETDSLLFLQKNEVERHKLRHVLRQREALFLRFDDLERKIARFGAVRSFGTAERVALGEDGHEAEEEKLVSQKDLFERFHRIWGTHIPQEISPGGLYPLTEEKLTHYQRLYTFDQTWRQTFQDMGRSMPLKLRKRLPELPDLITPEQAPRILRAYKSLYAQSTFFRRFWGELGEFVHWRIQRNIPVPEQLLDINVHIARALLRSEAETLNLNGLVELETPVARVLRDFQGDAMLLNGLQSIDVGTANALGSWRGNTLSLNGIRVLDADAAQGLGSWTGNYLHLSGLKDMDETVAKNLVLWKGSYLELNGLRQLDAKTAGVFSSWGGRYLSLTGLIRIDMETARRLAPFKGRIGLEASGFAPEIQEVLRK